MSNAAVQIARAISAMIPAKPAPSLFGSRGDVGRQEMQAHGAATAAAVAAWQYAAHTALIEAASAAPEGWVVDQDNHAFIDGVSSLPDLEAMCDPSYPWTGRRADQV